MLIFPLRPAVLIAEIVACSIESSWSMIQLTPGSPLTLAWMSEASLVLAKSASGMSTNLTLHFGQYCANSALIAASMPGVGMTPPTLGTSALTSPFDRRMTQSARSAAAVLNGAVSSAVTPAAQPSQAGGGVVESS